MTYDDLIQRMMSYTGQDKEFISTADGKEICQIIITSNTGAEVSMFRSGFVSVTDDCGAYIELSNFVTPEQMLALANIVM